MRKLCWHKGWMAAIFWGTIISVNLCSAADVGCIWATHTALTSDGDYVIEGVNHCDHRVEAISPLGFTVNLKFYDSQGFRLGWDYPLVAALDPHEKFRVVRPVPDYVSHSGKPSKVVVDSIQGYK